MGTPNLESIMDNVQTTLEGITAGTIPPGSTEAYHTTVTKVLRRHKLTSAETHASKYPMIQIWLANDDNAGHLLCRRRKDEQEFDLMCFLASASSDVTEQEVVRLREDIHAALYADPRRGGWADDTIYVGGYQGIDLDPAFGQLRMRWRVKYVRSILKE